MSRSPDVCYSLYELFYEKIENDNDPESDILDWEQKLLQEEAERNAPSDGRPGRKKS